MPDSKLSRVEAPARVGLQAGLMSLFSVVAFLVFCSLRPRNKNIYDPRHYDEVEDKVDGEVKNRDDIGQRPSGTSSFVPEWLQRLYSTEESDLLGQYKIGLDGVAFLRFTRMTRNLFGCIALLCCIVLIPVDIIYNLRNVSSDGRDVLSILTIRDVQGPYPYAHVAASYVISALVMVFIWINWKQMRDLRQKAWFSSSEYLGSSYARTLFVTNVPEAYRTDIGICDIFQIPEVIEKLKRDQQSEPKISYTATSGHMGRDVKDLLKLIERHDTAVRALEHVLSTCPKRKETAKEDHLAVRVGGFLRIGSKKVDVVDFYSEELGRRKQTVEHCREQIHKHEQKRKYGFVSMSDVGDTHRVARALHRKHPAGMDFALAPNPKDFIWKNLDKSPAELSRNRLISFLLLVLVCFFNIVALFIISTLSNLSFVITYTSPQDSYSVSPSILVSGVIAPAVSALLNHFLPIIMRQLTELHGVQTRSRLERTIISHHFTFLVISQLVIFTLIGVLYTISEVNYTGDSVEFQIIVNPISVISQAYVDQGSYWITYFALQGFLMIFNLVRIPNLVFISFKTRALARTPRNFCEWTQPPYFEYDTNYSNILFLATVAMVFAPLVPLVSLAGAIVFFISSWVYKYQLMFVSVTHIETGGRLWNSVCNRLLVPVVIMQLLLAVTIGIQYGFKSYICVVALPPILFVILFKILLYRAFNKKFKYYLPSEMEPPKAKIDLEKRFGHPALHAKLFRPTVYDNVTKRLTETYKDKSRVQEEQLGKHDRKMDIVTIEGGLTIAGVNQEYFESNPTLYPLDKDALDQDGQAIVSEETSGHHSDDRISGDSGEIAEEPVSPMPLRDFGMQDLLV